MGALFAATFGALLLAGCANRCAVATFTRTSALEEAPGIRTTQLQGVLRLQTDDGLWIEIGPCPTGFEPLREGLCASVYLAPGHRLRFLGTRFTWSDADGRREEALAQITYNVLCTVQAPATDCPPGFEEPRGVDGPMQSKEGRRTSLGSTVIDRTYRFDPGLEFHGAPSHYSSFNRQLTWRDYHTVLLQEVPKGVDGVLELPAVALDGRELRLPRLAVRKVTDRFCHSAL